MGSIICQVFIAAWSLIGEMFPSQDRNLEIANGDPDTNKKLMEDVAFSHSVNAVFYFILCNCENITNTECVR